MSAAALKRIANDVTLRQAYVPRLWTKTFNSRHGIFFEITRKTCDLDAVTSLAFQEVLTTSAGKAACLTN